MCLISKIAITCSIAPPYFTVLTCSSVACTSAETGTELDLKKLEKIYQNLIVFLHQYLGRNPCGMPVKCELNKNWCCRKMASLQCLAKINLPWQQGA